MQFSVEVIDPIYWYIYIYIYNQNQKPLKIKQSSLEGGSVNCSDRAFGGRPSTLAAGKERPLAVCICRADCLTCPALTRESLFISNTTGRIYFAIDTKPDEVHCKLQNYIYLLTCTHYGMQYVDECICITH